MTRIDQAHQVVRCVVCGQLRRVETTHTHEPDLRVDLALVIGALVGLVVSVAFLWLLMAMVP